CEAYAFEYSGGPVLCWLEVEVKGQRTLPRDWGATLKKNPSPGSKGKLVFLFPSHFHQSDPFHRFALSYQDDGRGAFLAVEVPDNALWRRPWKTYATTITCPLQGKRPTPERGKEVVLLTVTVEEGGAGAEPLRQVKVTLKAKLVERAAR